MKDIRDRKLSYQTEFQFLHFSIFGSDFKNKVYNIEEMLARVVAEIRSNPLSMASIPTCCLLIFNLASFFTLVVW